MGASEIIALLSVVLPVLEKLIGALAAAHKTGTPANMSLDNPAFAALAEALPATPAVIDAASMPLPSQLHD